MDVLLADNSVKNRWNPAISNPKADVHNINAHTKFGENPLIFTKVIPEMKILIYPGQITLSKIDKICLSAILKQISIISMHTPSLVKIYWYLLKLSSGNENMDLSWADMSTLSKIDKICPLTIRNQISTISTHTLSWVKIHWYFFKLSSGNKIMDWLTDIWQRTDGHTDSQHDIIIPGHYRAAGYKNVTSDQVSLRLGQNCDL